MTTDLEDFIKTKNSMGPDDYNNFDSSMWDLDGCKKILENFQLQENEEFEAFESEDTLSILNRYVEESDIDLQKSTIQDIIKEVYQEACEVI